MLQLDMADCFYVAFCPDLRQSVAEVTVVEVPGKSPAELFELSICRYNICIPLYGLGRIDRPLMVKVPGNPGDQICSRIN